MSESAVKLHSVTINRDLSVNKILKVSFSIQSISVIYGENGCGKTTFLRCLSAVLAQNESILLQEKVVSSFHQSASDHLVFSIIIPTTCSAVVPTQSMVISA